MEVSRADGKRKCRECRSCPSDPFSGACSERSETSKEVWIHYHESSIWRAVGRPETLPQIYREFGESFKGLDNWSAYMITSFEDAERYFGRKADKTERFTMEC